MYLTTGYPNHTSDVGRVMSSTGLATNLQWLPSLDRLRDHLQQGNSAAGSVLVPVVCAALLCAVVLRVPFKKGQRQAPVVNLAGSAEQQLNPAAQQHQPATGDTTQQDPVHVFVAHSGTEKWGVVSTIHFYFHNVLGLTTFADEWSLQPGQAARERILTDCYACKVGIAVLSREFLRRECPMEELHIFLQRRSAGTMRLVPALYDLTVEDLQQISADYKAGRWRAAGDVSLARVILTTWACLLAAGVVLPFPVWTGLLLCGCIWTLHLQSEAAQDRPKKETLQQWGSDLEELLDTVLLRSDQWRNHGRLVRLLAQETMAVLENLQVLKYNVELAPGSKLVWKNAEVSLCDDYMRLSSTGTVPTVWVVMERGTGNIVIYPLPSWNASMHAKIRKHNLDWVAYAADGHRIIPLTFEGKTMEGGLGRARKTCRYYGTRWLQANVLRQPAMSHSVWNE